MIEIYLNGENIQAEIEDEKTIGDILHSFEQTCEENEAAVIGIVINGKQITADIFDEEAAKNLEGNEKIEFSVVTKTNIQEAFKKLSSLFENLSEQMEEVPVKLQNNKKLEVTESIKILADSIDQFSHTAALASLFPESFSNTTINGMDFKDFFKDFSTILLDYENALQTEDSVLVGDLSEYEICPRLKAISESLKNY